ncbi:MAG: M15 family metallopeptidase [Prevotellaceae bacterium]|jgi:D-alanyl-D-alanine dipeptidase|nr:M15 family metallopeptidase [Prevotellaceae bacterium]
MKKYKNTCLFIPSRLILIVIFCPLICFSQDCTTVSAEAMQLKSAGLVDVRDLDSTIAVHLLYAGENNFMGVQMYKSLREAYLQAEVANMLVLAQKYLKQINPGCKLIVYDAARPQWAQVIMWNKVKDTPMKKYVSSPGRISMHTYGVAVDLGILSRDGMELDMGTPVDFLGALAEPRNEAKFLASGELSREQIKNRELLRTVMKKAGFRGIPNEWWHFEALTRTEAQKKYVPISAK